ncbi:hypothetical protein [Streptomyces sp. NPDC020817]|uniref:hypothetical protein n=1 Tax=Streptomyces sp. NPDC020817 TaxID=3365095 RepID=UPI0037A36BC1
MNVDDIVAERIEQARRKAAARKRAREELAEARRRGLAQRHAQKLRNLHPPTGNVPTSQQEQTADPAEPTAPVAEAMPTQHTKAAQTSTDRRSQ